MSGTWMNDPVAAPGEVSLAAYAEELVALAEAAIDHGLAHGRPPVVDCESHPPALREHRSSFVTLFDRAGELRGCMGSVEPYQPLVADVSANAFSAAFRDPRFLPLLSAEREGLSCKLSVLTLPEPVAFANEADLLAGLRPGVDGVIIESGERRGTFLPVVWEHLPDPVVFWRELKRKAGLPVDGIPEDLVVRRYEAESIG